MKNVSRKLYWHKITQRPHILSKSERLVGLTKKCWTFASNVRHQLVVIGLMPSIFRFADYYRNWVFFATAHCMTNGSLFHRALSNANVGSACPSARGGGI